jgi:hypothetical protein
MNMKRLIILIPIVLVLLIGISTANAQRTPALARYRASAVQVNEPASPQSGYSIEWYTIDGGGAMFSTGGSYSLGGSIGQPDAGSLGGGSYTLNGGFWGGASINYSIYLPLVLKNF